MHRNRTHRHHTIFNDQTVHMKIVVDANVIIDATDENSYNYDNAKRLFEMHESGRVKIFISRHTESELCSEKARDIGSNLFKLPHYPIGLWDQQVCNWNGARGIWGDAKRNEEINSDLERLACSGDDIRDRGAYIDALKFGADVFVTSDKHLVGNGPAGRIGTKFGLRILQPKDIINELNRKGA